MWAACSLYPQASNTFRPCFWGPCYSAPMQKHHLIIGAAVVGLTALVLTTRYEMVSANTDGVVYVLDRWTGAIRLIHGKDSYQVKPKD